MMKRFGWLAGILLLPACAHLGLGGSEAESRADQWGQAHQALGVQDFDRAAALFSRLAEEHPGKQEGREALFYLGSMRLDPRNPGWDPKPSEEFLRRYISADSAEKVRIYRRPEAETFLQLARQLNMPPEQRVAGLQPETRVVVRPERVVVPAQQSRALAAEAERLRGQVAERDAIIQQQREELERIRRTLSGRGSQRDST